MASCPDQSKNLSMLDGDDGNVSLDSSKCLTVQLDYLIIWCLDNAQLHASKV